MSLSELAYNPFTIDDYMQNPRLDANQGVIRSADTPVLNQADLFYKTVMAEMMAAKELGLNQVLIPNASEIINKRFNPTPEQAAKMGIVDPLRKAEWEEYKKQYDPLRRMGLEKMYNKARVEAVERLKKTFGDKINIKTIDLEYTDRGSTRKAPSTLIEFNFDFNSKVDMLKYSKGGLALIRDDIEMLKGGRDLSDPEGLNLFNDTSIWGDPEYSDMAMKEAVEAGVMSSRFFQKGGIAIPVEKPSEIDFMTKQSLAERESDLMFKDPLYRKDPTSFYAYRKRNFDYPETTANMNLKEATEQFKKERISKELGDIEFEADAVPEFRTTALGKLGFYPDMDVEKADEAWERSQGSYRPSDMTIDLTNDPEENKRIQTMRQRSIERNPLALPHYKLPHPELENMYILNKKNPTIEHEAIHRAIHILQNYYRDSRDYIIDKYGKRTDEVLFTMLDPEDGDPNYFQLANEVLTEQNDAIRSGAEWDGETYLQRTIKERDQDLENFKNEHSNLWNKNASVIENVQNIGMKTGKVPAHILNRITNISREDHEQLALNIFNIITDELPNLEELAKERLYDRNPEGGPTIDARGLPKGSLDEGFYDKLKVNRNSQESNKGFLARQIQKFRDRRNLRSNIKASQAMHQGF